MKHNIRKLALVLAVLLLCLSLAGCSDLENARKAQAFWNEDETITWNGAKYKRLPPCDTFNPLFPRPYSGYDVRVTESDVPVLLSSIGDYACSSYDKTLLRVAIGEYDYLYYCREDQYEALARKILQGPTFTGYYYQYHDADMGNFARYALTPAEVAAVNTVLETVEPKTYGDAVTLNWNYQVLLFECSEDLMFGKIRCYLSYYLDGNSKGYYLSFDDPYKGTMVYHVPASYHELYEHILHAEVNTDLPPDDGYIAF